MNPLLFPRAATTGAAGGGDSKITLRLPTEDVPAGSVLLDVAVEGLMGGHSGLNIHEDRGACWSCAASCQPIVAALQSLPAASRPAG